jgi:glycosyltransferase involved in cell wall biosynthesis
MAMKIVQLVPAMEQGGVERGVVEMNRALVGAGHLNVVISSGGRLVERIEEDGGDHITLDVKSKNPFTYFSRALALRRELREIKPDVVVAHSRVPAWLFVWANRTLGLKWITFAHGANSVSRYSRIMTAGDLTVTPSRYIADYLKDAYGIAEEKLRVIPRAIEREKFDPSALDQDFVKAKRAEWGIDGRKVVMGLGRITQLKGYDTLIKATAIVRKTVPNVKTVIVGEAEELRKDVEVSLRNLVKELSLEDAVVFAGNQQKVAECLSLADLVVSANTKKPEAFGRSMAEALAMNCPVVATGFGGALDIVENDVNGFLVPPAKANAEGFAEAIAKALGKDFGDVRTPALEKFSFDRMVSRAFAVYNEMAR